MGVAAWVLADTPGVPKNIFPLAIHDKLSDAELVACENLIRVIAKCPESSAADQSAASVHPPHP